mmetsp:Transcript_14412/g.22222  ORF Transcript_14412/g.22222 Transcript_14412/m.22222 type:complete len:221 (-) Transcript_14412:137-799(-)
MTTTNNNLSIIIAALLLSASSGFAPLSPVSSSSRSSHELLQSSSCPNIRTITSSSGKCNDEYSFARLSTVQRMASEDEEAEKTTESDAAAKNDDNSSSKAAAAGGGTIALTSAKSAADAAVSSSATTTTTTKNSSPSNTGFSLLLLPTLLIKFTIVLIVKFATDVVVYPTLYLWRWARLGRKKIGRGLARLLGREVVQESKGAVNGARTVVNGDSVGDFQ